jgi:hypothetical protein
VFDVLERKVFVRLLAVRLLLKHNRDLQLLRLVLLYLETFPRKTLLYLELVLLPLKSLRDNLMKKSSMNPLVMLILSTQLYSAVIEKMPLRFIPIRIYHALRKQVKSSHNGDLGVIYKKDLLKDSYFIKFNKIFDRKSNVKNITKETNGKSCFS